MKYSLAQLLEFVEESDIKFIRLAFCDSFGVQKNIAIMASQLAHAVENGVPVSYTVRRGMFGRFHYNALITLDGTRYYFYIKTIRGASFKRIMDKFCK